MKPQGTLIKMCGIKDAETAHQAAALGANFIGIIFHPASKRCVDLATAQQIAAAAQQSGATPVAVCVEQSCEQMLSICQQCNINLVQLHGDIAREQGQYLPQEIARSYVLTVDKRGEITNTNITSMQGLHLKRDYLLFDGLHAGSGERIITDKIKQAAGHFRYFLAGGLTPDNVAQAIKKSKPYAVDVASGIEDKAGNKSPALMQAFVTAVNLNQEAINHA